MLEVESLKTLTTKQQPPEPTPPIALAMIEKLRGRSTGPKFRKLPGKKQAEM